MSGNFKDAHTFYTCHVSSTIHSQLIVKWCTSHVANCGHKLLNGTKAPIVTSLHELAGFIFAIQWWLPMPVYFVRNTIVGHPVKFTGAVSDFLEILQSQQNFSIL